MVTAQISRRKNADSSETLIRKSDGLTLSYSEPSLTTMLSTRSTIALLFNFK
jgi:hypothetical protein